MFKLKSIRAKHLANLYNISLQSGVIPDDWKNFNVISLFTKGSRADIKNNKPASLTSISCKLLEIIKDQINEHLNKYKPINDTTWV